MRRLLYSGLLRLALPFVLARLAWRSIREPGYRRTWRERFGFGARLVGPDGSALVPIWIHAVSVGEARAATSLVSAMKTAWPARPILFTCMTAAGRQTIEQLFPEASVRWLPYDLPGSVRRFLERTRPALGILMETEIWPNLIDRSVRQGVPLILANARMSEKSAAGYARRLALFGPAFNALAAVCAQSKADAERIRGLRVRDIRVTGNLKFDTAALPTSPEARDMLSARLGDRSVLFLASSREGEEELFLEALRANALSPRVIVAIAPRHPRRFDGVAALLTSRVPGRIPRRQRGEVPAPGEQYWLCDTMGEMALLYALAEVTIVGGGFRALGGQNPIEACASGSAVIVGPHMFNFADVTRLGVEEGAIRQCGDPAEAVEVAIGLLGDPVARDRIGEAGRAFVARHRGATERHLAVIRDLIERRE